jgi:hypothetical protein
VLCLVDLSCCKECCEIDRWKVTSTKVVRQEECNDRDTLSSVCLFLCRKSIVDLLWCYFCTLSLYKSTTVTASVVYEVSKHTGEGRKRPFCLCCILTCPENQYNSVCYLGLSYYFYYSNCTTHTVVVGSTSRRQESSVCSFQLITLICSTTGTW